MFFRGLLQGLALGWPVRVLVRHPSIRAMTARCVLLNGVLFLGSMLLFDFVVHPLVVALFGSASAVPAKAITFLYHVLWLYPVYIVTFVASSSLHSRIAREAMSKIHRGGGSGGGSGTGGGGESSSASFAGAMADAVYKMLLYLAVLVQTMACDLLVPYVGWIFSLALTSLVYSFLAFDIKWSFEFTAWRLRRRIEEFEARWAFFLGFGLPFTLTNMYFPLLVNCGIYSLLFPFFLMMVAPAKERDNTCVPLRVFKPAAWITSLLSSAVQRIFDSKSK
jgi:etoposide-induced 2.4 mRNA